LTGNSAGGVRMLRRCDYNFRAEPSMSTWKVRILSVGAGKRRE